MKALLLAAALQTTVSPVIVRPVDPKDPAVERGRHLVARNCRGCHSVQSKGISIDAHAPPFRWMKEIDGKTLQRVAVDVAAGDHFAMPPVVLTRSESEDIAAFIRAFANAEGKTQRKLSLPSCFARQC